MVRLLLCATVMSALAFRVALSPKMRLTTPLTVMRVEMVTSLLTTYQPVDHEVVLDVTSVAFAHVFVVPSASMY